MMPRRIVLKSKFISEVKNEPSLSAMTIREEELNVVILLMTKAIHPECLRLKAEIKRRMKGEANLRTVRHNDT
jgi:hypothetical protein